MRNCTKNRFVSTAGRSLVRPKVDLSMGSWECGEATELRAIVEKHSVEPKLRHVKKQRNQRESCWCFEGEGEGKSESGGVSRDD